MLCPHLQAPVWEPKSELTDGVIHLHVYFRYWNIYPQAVKQVTAVKAILLTGWRVFCVHMHTRSILSLLTHMHVKWRMFGHRDSINPGTSRTAGTSSQTQIKHTTVASSLPYGDALIAGRSGNIDYFAHLSAKCWWSKEYILGLVLGLLDLGLTKAVVAAAGNDCGRSAQVDRWFT